MSRLRVTVLLALAFGATAGVFAQQTPGGLPPEIERSLRQGSAEDEDLSAEESTELERYTGKRPRTWAEFIADWMTPRPIPKEVVRKIDAKYAYPHVAVAFKMEIVKEDDKYVWLKGIPPEDPQSPLHRMWQDREAHEMYYKLQRKWIEEHGVVEYFLDFGAEQVPPPFMDAVTFEGVASALPRFGRWQMSFDVADMNGDGVLDLVFPPTRKGTAKPVILTGLGTGEFSFWNTAWSKEVPFDYGGIATGDFDQDGNMDVVLAIHFRGQYLLFGDGQGGFERSMQLPAPDYRITSRAVTAADFDGDSRLDLAFLAEIDYDLGNNARIEDSPTVWVLLNRGDRWAPYNEGLPKGVIGDNITTADVNRDGRVDLVLSSNSANWRKLVFLNGDKEWSAAEFRGVLSNAYHSDVVVVDQGLQDHLDLFATFVQFRMINDENQALTGLVQYEAGKHGITNEGATIYWDDDRGNQFFRIAVGDLNNDGRSDVVAARKHGGVAVFVQTPGGELYQEQAPELDWQATPYDIHLVDLNGDGCDDIVASFADREINERKKTVSGGVWVWLSKPVS
jgi:hypothetical protein